MSLTPPRDSGTAGATAVKLMSKELKPSSEDFDCLLAWFDVNRERAALRYEEIRRRLIKVFARRGCPEGDSESLADETINRVTLNACEVAPGFKGDPAIYFLAVGKNVLHE